MVLPTKHGVVWCPKCDWTGQKGDLLRTTAETAFGPNDTVLACPECGVRLETV